MLPLVVRCIERKLYLTFEDDNDNTTNKQETIKKVLLRPFRALLEI